MLENGKLKTKQGWCAQKHQWFNAEGQLHRLDGPASICPSSCNGSVRYEDEFFIDGEKFTENEWRERVEEMRQEALDEIEQRLIRCFAWIITQKIGPGKSLRIEAFDLRSRLRRCGREIDSKQWKVINEYLDDLERRRG